MNQIEKTNILSLIKESSNIVKYLNDKNDIIYFCVFLIELIKTLSQIYDTFNREEKQEILILFDTIIKSNIINYLDEKLFLDLKSKFYNINIYKKTSVNDVKLYSKQLEYFLGILE